MQQAQARVGSIELGAFRLTRLLAAGSFATAYLAEQVSTAERVVVKIAHPDLFLGERARELRARFEIEARAAARVRHPSLVRILAAGSSNDGVPAIAMDYVAGPSLAAVLTARHGVDLAFVDRCISGLADTLRLLHDAGVVHRDVTPRNVVWTSTSDGIGRPVLLDFGVAKLDNRSLGTVGAMGTPGYMPPEQLFGRAVPRSDVYALGAILWWACTGRSFMSQFDDVEDLLAYQMGERQAPNPSEAGRTIPDDLADLLVWALEPEPGARPTAVQLLDAWRAIHPALVQMRFTPPAAASQAAPTRAIPAQAASAQAAPAPVVSDVCVTMDDPQLLRLVAAYLRGEGHTVEVTTAPSAARSDRRAAPRLFVLEADAQGLDADDTAAELKTQSPACAVLLVSSKRRPTSRTADDGFQLPAELDAFATRVYELLHGGDAVPNTSLPLALNRDTVARLSETSDPGLLASRIDGFLEDFSSWAAQLEVAIGTNDWGTARSTCARMSRAASQLGADRLADLAQVVHALAEARAPSVGRIVGDLHAEFGRVRQALSLTRAQFLHA